MTLGIEDIKLFADGVMDAVYVGVMNDPTALKQCLRVLRMGGYLCATTDIRKLMETSGTTWDLVKNDGLQVYQKGGPGYRESWKKPKAEKRALVIRYGGIGDIMQAGSTFPGLKRQGYSVTVATYEVGRELLKADPNVDDFVIQDRDQVPNDELGEYVDYLRTQYDKVVHLSESVEGSLVALPNRPSRTWPKGARRFLMDRNYLEMTHAIAEVPEPYEMRFYPTQDEREWAAKMRTHISGKPIILWALSGSSVNKAWPYVDQIVARLMTTFTDCRVIFVGGEADAWLEAGWDNEKRVIKRCGQWSIREAITFAQRQADLVIGPDTGILNAVGLEQVPKVLILGHSTKEQVSKHWINTTSIEPPPSVPCAPCLQLHYNFSDCHRGPNTGVALCQEAIPADIVWAAILGALNKTKRLQEMVEHQEARA